MTSVMPAASAVVNEGLVSIPGGSFLMGDRTGDGYAQERPVHAVRVRPFLAARCCVTVAEYAAFIAAAGADFDELWCDFINPCFILKLADGYRVWPGAERYPMVQVSFVGAVAYANWLSRRHGLAPVYDLATLDADLGRDGFRLLTEAEWEWACGGPRRLAYGYGTAFDPQLVNHRHLDGDARALRASRERIGGFGLHAFSPVPVGSLPPNAFGLHEMLGNVNEWCHDRYAPYTSDAQDQPAGAATGSFRAIRGGSFLDERDKLRSSYRHAIHYRSKCMIDGFRLAKNL